MRPFIKFEREKIKAKFGNLNKFAASYNLKAEILKYRVKNPYYTRTHIPDYVFEIYKQMQRDGFLKIIDAHFKM